MTVLQVHNFYQQPGGEDLAFEAEGELLSQHGHQVIRYTAHNDSIRGMSAPGAGVRAVWNHDSYQAIRHLLRRHKPAVMHVHNTFPLISPAVHYAAAVENVPVIQTLHNYRLICPAATLFRGGRVCEDCLHSRTHWAAVRHACYRNSRAATAASCCTLTLHRAAGTWSRKVQRFIALTKFAKHKLVEGGLAANRITVKPNFLFHDPGPGQGSGGYALFAGRLSEEKGVRVMLEAWRRASRISLKIAGDGPLRRFVQEQARLIPKLEYLGHCGRQRVIELLQSAEFLVFPSEWYEGLPMSVVEAFACGTPIAGSALGSMEELIQDGVNGILFQFGDPDSLANCVEQLATRARDMRKAARAAYERSYTAERNYELLMNIYESAGAAP